MLEVIRSGGQTGPDRAAILSAIENKIAYTGYVPADGWAEDFDAPPGLLADFPELIDSGDENPATRTLLNVAHSDGTLIIRGSVGTDSMGTEITEQACYRANKPCLIVYDINDAKKIAYWIAKNKIQDLNIAGPRESESQGIQLRAKAVIDAVIKFLDSKNYVKHIK